MHELAKRRGGKVRFSFSEKDVRRFIGRLEDHTGHVDGSQAAADWFRLRSAAERLALRPGFDELIALDANAIDELPHQTQTAVRVLKHMGGRAILADEVGLGKTIEAGLILKELLTRRLARRVLVLSPASLVDQWIEEMADKFYLQFGAVEDRSDWTSRDLVIASHSRARHKIHRSKVTERPWDVVIVDEAHKAKNHRTQLYRTLEEIERDFILLLTATPLQNDLREFFNLVTLVRPGQFGTWRGFKGRYMGSDPRVPRDPAGIRDVASAVLIRNKRSNVNLHLPRRRPHRPQIVLTDPEASLYRDVTSFARALYAVGMYPDAASKGAQSFVLTLIAQRICSSSPAIADTLRRIAGNQDVRPEFRSRAGELERAARAVTSHTKLRALDAALQAHSGERVVVFSEHRPTIELIQRHVEALGRPVFPYHGGVTKARRARLKREFRDTPRGVFLSSRAGAEGLNLQFAHVLVNYELPWNPLLVEQRIGRLHRIGQKHEVVIYNLAAAGTVEDRILEVLQNKIRLFELVVGELDLILGRFDNASELEARFKEAWLSASSEQAFERDIQAIEHEVETGFEAARQAEQMSNEIAPEDNAERLEREFRALTIPKRVYLAYGTQHMNLAAGTNAERMRIGLSVAEIQAALTYASVHDLVDAGVSDYGPTVWIHSATSRGRGVSLRVAADRLPITLVEIAGDEQAPLTNEVSL